MPRQYTSARAYEENHGKFSCLKGKIMTILENYKDEGNIDGMSNHEIAVKLQIPTATMSGLMRPLAKDDKVRQLRKRKCKITGNTVIAWATKPPLPRLVELRREIHGEPPQQSLL